MRPGTRLGHFEILSLVGAGGMGEVYRARDERLGREVAIKVLSPALCDDSSRLRRFELEARAAAALESPYILAVHDVGSWEGRPYIVTELLEGESLRSSLTRSPVATSKAVEMAAQISQGLAVAHDKGILHRDLKPENVFVTRDGGVKILDFGLAKLTQAEPVPAPGPGTVTTPAFTEPGAVLGTVGYMSPEQLQGLPVDHRSDIFSLGCVLYEVFSGRRAFNGRTPAMVSSAILHDNPPPLAEADPSLPPALDHVVSRCLEKQPSDRFESARDVAFALRAATAPSKIGQPKPRRRRAALRVPIWAAVAVAGLVLVAGAVHFTRTWLAPLPLPEAKHLAVMRFSADGNDSQVLAQGLTELVTNGLCQLEADLPVGTWTVPFQEARKRSPTSVGDLHRDFGVSLVVTGSMQHRGDRIRLELSLMDAASDQVLSSIVLDDSLNNLSVFQEEPVLRVVQMLDLQVTPQTRDQLAWTMTTMPEAFRAYLAATGLVSSSQKTEDLDRAIALLESATAQDPLYTAARVALGGALLEKSKQTGGGPWLARALAEAERASGDTSKPAAALSLLAAAKESAGDLAGALALLESAAAAEPAKAEIHVELARTYQKLERFSDAEKELQRAVFLRPGYWPTHHQLALLYLSQGNHEAAATQWREVITCAPKFTRGYNNLGTMYFFLGRNDEAREVFERSLALEPTRVALSNLGTLYFEDARYGDAADMYNQALEADDSHYKTWGNLAFAYKFGESPDKAEGAFRRAVELSEARVADATDDLQAATDLADYYAMLGDRTRGLQLIEKVIARDPTDPLLVADVAECLWDLNEHVTALHWVRRSFEAGVPRRRFEKRPTLRDLVADERYRQLVEELANNS